MNDLLNIYLSELEDLTPLTQAQEASATDEQLVNHNLRYVVSLAKRYVSSNSEEFMDLIQAGNVGLIEASRSFDRKSGVKFTVWATHSIKGRIIEAVKAKYLVKLPSNSYKNHSKIQRLVNIGLPEEEVAKELGLNVCDVRAVSQSKETLVTDELSDSFSPKKIPVFDDTRRNFIDSILRTAKRSADPRSAYVIQKKLEGFTPKEIGVVLGVSRQRVNQIEDIFYKSLRPS